MIKKLLCLLLFFLSFQWVEAQQVATTTAHELPIEEQLSFYPNPAQEEVRVTNTTGDLVDCVVFNILGDKVLSTSLASVQTDLSLEHLPNGVYIVAFNYKDQTITERLIKE